MANSVIISHMTPFHWTEIDPVEIPNYISRHLDDYQFEETILDYEQPVKYYREWMKVDSARIQIKTNYTPVVLKLYSCDGQQVYSQNFTNRQQDADRPGTYIRYAELDFSTFPVGQYYFTINIGSGPLVMVSEPFKLVDTSKNTLYIEYSHYEKFGGLYFQSPYSPAIRVPAVLKYNDTASKDTIFEDDPESETLLRSTPYRIWDFVFGSAAGVPPWFADKIKRIFCCSDVKIDGRYYTKSDGAKWERTDEANYPMAGWRIQLRETFNREELMFEDDVQIIGVAAAGLIVSAKHFGISDEAGDDFLEIISAT